MARSRTSRRQFLAGSALSLAAAGVAPLSARAGARSSALLSIHESFAPPEWLEAVTAVAASNRNPGDAALRGFSGGPTHPAPGEFRLLTLPAPGVEPFAPELARRLAVLSNDRLAETVRTSGGAIGGLATVSAFDRNAVAEAERAITTLGLSGISLGANRGMRLDDRQLWPLYDFAQAAGAPIYLPAGYTASLGDAPYRALGREGVIAGAAADSAAHATQIVFGGVLDAFPRLNVILARLGEATPHWYGELSAIHTSLADEGSHARPQRELQDYFRSNIRLTTCDIESAGTLHFCHQVLGKGRVVLSSRHPLRADYPAGAFAALTRISFAEVGRTA